MKLASKIICKTVGTIGMGVALYDSCRVANHYKNVRGEIAEQKHIEDVYFNTRTLDKLSYTNSAHKKNLFEMRTNHNIYEFIGKCKGLVEGFIYGLGNHLPTIFFSTIALLCKNTCAKIGAIGVAGYALLKSIKDGFGISKNHPMN